MAKRIEVKYYVIIDRKRERIWKTPYATRREAETELSAQTKMLPAGQTANHWKIEEMTTWRDTDMPRADGFDGF